MDTSEGTAAESPLSPITAQQRWLSSMEEELWSDESPPPSSGMENCGSSQWRRRPLSPIVAPTASAAPLQTRPTSWSRIKSRKLDSACGPAARPALVPSSRFETTRERLKRSFSLPRSHPNKKLLTEFGPRPPIAVKDPSLRDGESVRSADDSVMLSGAESDGEEPAWLKDAEQTMRKSSRPAVEPPLAEKQEEQEPAWLMEASSTLLDGRAAKFSVKYGGRAGGSGGVEGAAGQTPEEAVRQEPPAHATRSSPPQSLPLTHSPTSHGSPCGQSEAPPPTSLAAAAERIAALERELAVLRRASSAKATALSPPRPPPPLHPTLDIFSVPLVWASEVVRALSSWGRPRTKPSSRPAHASSYSSTDQLYTHPPTDQPTHPPTDQSTHPPTDQPVLPPVPVAPTQHQATRQEVGADAMPVDVCITRKEPARVPPSPSKPSPCGPPDFAPSPRLDRDVPRRLFTLPRMAGHIPDHPQGVPDGKGKGACEGKGGCDGKGESDGAAKPDHPNGPSIGGRPDGDESDGAAAKPSRVEPSRVRSSQADGKELDGAAVPPRDAENPLYASREPKAEKGFTPLRAIKLGWLEDLVHGTNLTIPQGFGIPWLMPHGSSHQQRPTL